MLNFLDSIGDQRKGYFFAKNSQGGYGGNFFGETLSGTAVTSAFGSGLLPSASAPRPALFRQPVVLYAGGGGTAGIDAR